MSLNCEAVDLKLSGPNQDHALVDVMTHRAETLVNPRRPFEKGANALWGNQVGHGLLPKPKHSWSWPEATPRSYGGLKDAEGQGVTSWGSWFSTSSAPWFSTSSFAHAEGPVTLPGFAQRRGN